MFLCRCLFITAIFAILAASPAAEQPGQRPKGPLSPREEMTTFRVPKGFEVMLVACEPQVVDPVAMAFDEKGRIYVAEMPGYPNNGVATGTMTTGRIKLLENKDGNGYSSTVYLDGLRFPTSVMPYKGGLLVVNAPDLIFCEDTKGTGKADKVRTLYTGFVLNNIQQLPSGLQWGLDNWVHACAGGVGGTITSVEKPDAPAVVLRGRGFRFHPEVPGSLEPTSGGGQFGLATDAWGHWFTATNSQHLRQIVLPDHYLRRNPNLPVSTTIIDIPDHGAACKVHRISPYESWRVERTTMRKDGPDAKRFPPTELFPGGYITSACSPLVYEADWFPKEYRGNVFVCEPANNLIHRDVLVPNGATFIAKRAEGEENCEFFASTDTWCRPVCVSLGPDGGDIYVLDFYREVIETPLSLTEDMKRTLPLKSAGKGRIWRIGPNFGGGRPPPYSVPKANKEGLVGGLDIPNYWWRIHCQQKLIELQDKTTIPALVERAKTGSPPGRVHALWTLQGLGGLEPALVRQALNDSHSGVRAQAVKLAEPWLAKDAVLREAVMSLWEDPAFEVRIQLALSAGEAKVAATTGPLPWVMLKDSEDPWMRTALLSSCQPSDPRALLTFMGLREQFRESTKPGFLKLVTQLAALMTGQGAEKQVVDVLGVAALDDGPATWQLAVLEGWGQGLKIRGLPLDKVWASGAKDLATIRLAITRAVQQAGAVDVSVAERAVAVRLIAYGALDDVEPVLRELLTPQTPVELQVAAISALANHNHAKVGDILLGAWKSASPSLRRELLDALLARSDRVAKLLDAVERKEVVAGQIEPSKLALLRKYPDAKVRVRAEKILKDQVIPARQDVIARYEAAKLAEKPDPARGKLLFKKTCAVCHRLENEGTEVGPDLLSALGSKTPESLLIDILDPSREVDPRYLEYVVTLKDGRLLTGLIAAETASSITLRRAEKAEDTLLRGQIDDIRATAKSLMPEGLETQLNPQELYDVIAYLMQVKTQK